MSSRLTASIVFGGLTAVACADTSHAPHHGSVGRDGTELTDSGLDAGARRDAASTELDAARTELDAARTEPDTARTELDAARVGLEAMVPSADRAQRARDIAWETDAAAGSCPESGALALAIAYEGGELSSASWYFSHPYGLPFFFLDGQGRYILGDRTLSGVRQGQLSVAEVDALRVSLHLANLPSWPTLNQRGGGITPSLVIHTSDAVFTCNDCEKEGNPESRAVAAMMNEVLERLGATTAPLEGPLSIVVLDRNLPPEPGDEPWPLTWSPLENAVSFDQQVDLERHTRTVVGDEANKLRALRDARSEMLQYDVGFCSVAYAGKSLLVSMRAVLPSCLAKAVVRWRPY